MRTMKTKYLFLLILLSTSTLLNAQWINELHYDDSGSGDLNEGVEIAGLAGTDLSCYQLIHYNGNGGSIISTVSLSGTIPDEGCGYGAVWIDYESEGGLQNGNDALALIDCSNNVIQFIDWEGTVTATAGVANGMSSSSIGVNETNSTTIGTSLQLTGNGSTYGDYTWQSPSTSSHGTLNSGQSIDPCGSIPNTITTGTLSGAPFMINCTNSIDASGTLSFSSTDDFNGGNIFTAELSDASGDFSSPISIGSFSASGTAPSGSINLTIPSSLASGNGYQIRIVSSDPVVTSGLTSTFTITQMSLCTSSLPTTEGLLINEFSNGSSGSQEYYEFVVAGRCGSLVDIRGYILDDNNGTFSATFPSTSGIAPGHLRLTNHSQWASIPVGSLIVIYNADDINSAVPSDDISDSDNDSLYVIPHNNSSLFELTATLPANSVGDSIYSPVTYNSTSWSPLGIRNSGDAIQVRSPDGTYWHGVSYGGAEMTGGPNDMKIKSSGMSGEMGYFNDGDYLDASNWSTGTAGTSDETPGLPNNAANLAWLREMRDPFSSVCPITVLPITMTKFEGAEISEGNLLTWITMSEKNADYFFVEKSFDGNNWVPIGRVKCIGNSEVEQHYQLIDSEKSIETIYYRLRQVDNNGQVNAFHRIVTITDVQEANTKKVIATYNLLGQEVNEDFKGIIIQQFEDGTSAKANQ